MGTATAIGSIFGPIGTLIGLGIDQTNKTKKDARDAARQNEELLNNTKAQFDAKNKEEERLLSETFYKEQKMSSLKEAAIAKEKALEKKANSSMYGNEKSEIITIDKSKTKAPILLGGYNFLNKIEGR